jgi:hypothetical protein
VLSTVENRVYTQKPLAPRAAISLIPAQASVGAASRRHVGKETDRRWEQGEDISLIEFQSFEYQHSKQVVAGDDIKEDILRTGIRKLEHETGVHHTLEKVLQGEGVRRRTLDKIVRQLSILSDQTDGPQKRESQS